MQKNKIAIAVVSSLLAVSSVDSFAVQNTNIEYSMVHQRYEKINVGVSLVDSVRSALLASYTKNNAWPISPSKLVSDGFINSVSAPWGSVISGVMASGGNTYTLVLATPEPLVAQGIASKLGAVAVGNSIQLVIPVPAASSIAANMVSRVAVPGQPDRNKMFTDIDMNSYALNNVGKMDVVLINAQQSNVGSLTVETAFDVKPDATFRRNVGVGGDISIVGKSTSAQVEANYLKINGGADLLGPVNVNGDVNASSFVASRDIVAGQTVRGSTGQFNTLIVNTSLKADSATLNKADIVSLTAGQATVTGLFKALGPSDFAQDALFRGSVMINGALTVGGIASAMDIREGGILLRDKYLGIGAKAVDSDKLDGLDSTAFAQREAANTFTGVNTFTQMVNANGGLSVDGKVVISSDGSTLYENGVALSSKYLGKNDTAQDSYKLGGIAAVNYARTDIDEVFDRSVTVNGRVYAKNGIHVQNDWVRVDGQNGLFFESYGGGWHMTDSSTIRAYGGKSIFTSGAMYEFGTELSQRYLGKTDKAVSAVTADNATNAEKLGNVAAASYARKDVPNTFTGLQTFNGGIRAVGSSVLDTVTINNALVVNGNVSFKDSKGVTRTLKDTYAKVTSLEDWRAACQRDMTSPTCGLTPPENNGGGSKVVWTGSSISVENIWGEGVYNIATYTPRGSMSGTVNTNGTPTLLYTEKISYDCGSEGGCRVGTANFYILLDKGSFKAYLNSSDSWSINKYYNLSSITKF